jgi:hypothetical protein
MTACETTTVALDQFAGIKKSQATSPEKQRLMCFGEHVAACSKTFNALKVKSAFLAHGRKAFFHRQ